MEDLTSTKKVLCDVKGFILQNMAGHERDVDRLYESDYNTRSELKRHILLYFAVTGSVPNKILLLASSQNI